MVSAILAIDQGTTSTRTVLFDERLKPLIQCTLELSQHFPHPGWVEHCPKEIWNATLNCCKQAHAFAAARKINIEAIGITNQRETTLVWDKSTGQCLTNAIVWQDRRTEPLCEQMRQQNMSQFIHERTGLVIDPYFSATKIKWILDNVHQARARANNGELLFGTIDSYLLWQLSAGASHKTDITNASRTMLFNIHTMEWDADLLKLFDIPEAMLPQVNECTSSFGYTNKRVYGERIAILGMAGDQQAASIGQACFVPGMVKSTYGTGCFAMINTGNKALTSSQNLLTTIAYRFRGNFAYALEGSIFSAGVAIQWLRDNLKIFHNASNTAAMARNAIPNDTTYMVPAFTGLGAPYWDANARASLHGMTRGTGPNELVRAALDSVCYQTYDLLKIMRADVPDTPPKTLRVDGGMIENEWLMQRLADICDVTVDRPIINETTALGAAYLAGLEAGVYLDPKDFCQQWQLRDRYTPALDPQTRTSAIQQWHWCVARTLSK